MNIFLEKEFINNFYIEYEENSHIEEWKLLYILFTEYNNIKLFINTTNEEFEEVIESNEILMKLSDINPNIQPYSDLKNEIKNSNSVQTLVFTEKEKDWFKEIDSNIILHFTYSDFEDKLKEFIERNHLEFDLSDKDSNFNWDLFHFIADSSNVIIISDPFILKDKDNQKISKNLIPLLMNNLHKDQTYKVFIISNLKDVKVDKILQVLNSKLAAFDILLYIINIIDDINKPMELHDRLLYTNYSITTSGIGFNINPNKTYNSEILTKTIFHKKTYKKYVNHFKLIGEYIDKLEKFTDYENSFKTNTDKLYEEFRSLNVII